MKPTGENLVELRSLLPTPGDFQITQSDDKLSEGIVLKLPSLSRSGSGPWTVLELRWVGIG